MANTQSLVMHVWWHSAWSVDWYIIIIIIIIKNEKIRVTLCENAAGALYIVNKMRVDGQRNVQVRDCSLWVKYRRYIACPGGIIWYTVDVTPHRGHTPYTPIVFNRLQRKWIAWRRFDPVVVDRRRSRCRHCRRCHVADDTQCFLRGVIHTDDVFTMCRFIGRLFHQWCLTTNQQVQKHIPLQLRTVINVINLPNTVTRAT